MRFEAVDCRHLEESSGPRETKEQAAEWAGGGGGVGTSTALQSSGHPEGQVLGGFKVFELRTKSEKDAKL